MREDVGPATNQTLHIERYLVVGFAISVEYDAAKCKTAQYGRLFGWINSQGTNQPDGILGRNSDGSAQVGQPPHGGLIGDPPLAVKCEATQQLDIDVVSEFRFLDVLGHGSPGSCHLSEIVFCVGADHETYGMKLRDPAEEIVLL